MTLQSKLLIVGALPAGLHKALSQNFELVPLWTVEDRASFLQTHQGQFAGGVTMSRYGCQADVFACLRDRVLVCFGVGFDGIDLQAAKINHVAVSTTPDVLTDCVADIAFALMLGVARQIVPAAQFVQEGHWAQGAFGLSTRVSGKRLGIVGLGRIGAAIAKRAQGFDMAVSYFARHAVKDKTYVFQPNLKQLAADSDFLVIACKGGAETKHLISTEVLKALGPTGFLINIARGSVIDEAALVRALQSQEIAGAGLDVLTHEPQVPEALLNNSNVLILPHVAASTFETRAGMEKLVIDNLNSFLNTGKVLTPPV
jgi:phosphoglycerate dehydrogenase-like enzyme